MWSRGCGAQGDEAFKCEVCNEKCEATKRLRLFRLPQMLLLHIKRFKYTGSSREKLTNNVTFPIKVCKPVPAACACGYGSFQCVGFNCMYGDDAQQEFHACMLVVCMLVVTAGVSLPSEFDISQGHCKIWP